VSAPVAKALWEMSANVVAVQREEEEKGSKEKERGRMEREGDGATVRWMRTRVR